MRPDDRATSLFISHSEGGPLAVSRVRLTFGVSLRAIVIGAAAMSAPTVLAEQWLGTFSSDWYDPLNWNGGVPAGAFDVGINRILPHSVVISGGAIDLAGKSIAVGTTSDGAMTISGGATLTSGQSTITADPVSTGIVTVTGLGSAWSTDTFVVGYRGQAQLRIEDGGLVQSGTTSLALHGGTATVVVDGSGSRWEVTDTDTRFGYRGQADVTISDGGVVAHSGSVALGIESTASGDVVVDGTGSRWEIAENLVIGHMGTASLAISNGGYVTADIVTLGSATVGNVASLVLDGQDSELSATGGIRIGFGTEPVMRVTGGAKLATGKQDPNPFIGRTYVGYNQARGQTASLLVSGAGSSWEDAGYIVIGNTFGDANVRIEAGGTLRGVAMAVGTGRGIDASNPANPFYVESQLIVTGAGTTADVDWVAVGNAGAKATAEISAGATMTTQTTLIGGGATWNNTYVALSDVDLILGGAGTRWITAKTGEHSFTVDSGDIRILVTDQARLEVAGDMELGGYGPTVADSTLQMTIDQAGMVTAGGDVFLGRRSNSAAAAVVEGAGSQWTVAGQMVVGDAGSGTLRVVDAATFDAATVEIARIAGSSGKLIVGGETVAATAGTLVTPVISFGAGNGELIFNHLGNIAIASSISGSGTIRHNAGSTTMQGNAAGFSGTTHVDGGMLTLLDRFGGTFEVGDGVNIAELVIDAGGDVNGAAINVDRHASATFHSQSNAQNAAITVAGAASIQAGADLTGARLAAAAGGWFDIGFDPLGAETRRLGSIEGAGDFQLAGLAGDDILEIGSNHRSTTVSGQISELFDAVGLTKVGNGTLTLSGTNTYTGGTSVDGGILNVAGSLVSAVTVNSGGALAGIGSIGGLDLKAGGTLTPGNSIGTINVIGHAAFDTGSTYVVELSGGGNMPGVNNDRVVAGTASVANGAIFQVVPVSGAGAGPAYAPNTQYTVIQTAAPGGLAVTGEQTIVDNFAFLRFAGHDDGQNYYLTSSAAAASFCLAGASANQCQTGNAVRDLGTGHSAYDTVVGMGEAEANAAFDALSGEIQASGQHVIDQTFSMFGRTLRGQGLSGLGSGPAGAPAYAAPLGYASAGTPIQGVVAIEDATADQAVISLRNVWLAPLAGRGTVLADGNAAALEWWAAGIAGGYGGMVDTGRGLAHAGIGIGYVSGHGAVDARRSSADSQGVNIGAYGGWTDGPWTLAGTATYAANAISTKRHILVGGINQTATADYWSQSVGFSSALLYGFDIGGGTTLSPLFTLDAGWSGHGGFTETGAGALNLTAASAGWGRIDAGIGIALKHAILTDSGEVVLESRAVWEHAFAGIVPSQSLSFAGGPAGFEVKGPDAGRDRFRFGAALAFQASEAIVVRASYDGMISGSQQNHGASISFNVKF